MLDNFLQILPEVIFDAAETLGGRCTGRFYALHALENRVYDIEMEEGPHVVIKFYRPGRWCDCAEVSNGGQCDWDCFQFELNYIECLGSG